MTEPAGPPNPGAPSSGVVELPAWLLALLPLIECGGVKIARLAGLAPGTLVVLAICGVVNSAVALTDAVLIRRSGRNPRRIYLVAWALILVPVYLVQRTRALRRSYLLPGVWLASFVVGLALSIGPLLLRGNVYWGIGLPPCTASFSVRQVTTVFGTIARMKNAGVTAVELLDPAETSATDVRRVCTGVVLGSDGARYNVRYEITLEGTTIYTRLYILNSAPGGAARSLPRERRVLSLAR